MTAHSNRAESDRPLSPAELAALVEYGPPAIAPDGRRVAVIRTAPAATDGSATSLSIVGFDVDAEQPTPERLVPVRHPQCEPCWTIDSTALVVAERPESAAVPSLRVVPADGAVQRTIPLPAGIARVRKLIADPTSPDQVFVLAEPGSTLEPAEPAEPGRTDEAGEPGQPVEPGANDSTARPHTTGRTDGIAPPHRGFVGRGLRDVRSRPGPLWSFHLPTGKAVPTNLGDLDTADVADLAIHPGGTSAAVLVPDHTHPARPATLYVVRPGANRPGEIRCARATRPTSRDRTLEFSPDGRYLLFSHGDERSGHRPAIVPVDGGTVRPLPHPTGTVLSACWSADRRVLAQIFRDLRSELVELDLDGRVVRQLGTITTGQPRFSISRATDRVAVVSGSTDAGPELSIRSANGDRRLLCRANPWLTGRSTGRVSEIWWSSSLDGVDIGGLLVTPPGHRQAKGAGRLPMVVDLHGGPHFHWSTGWLGSWVDWAQLLATHGFAVLLPNPRGSTGRDWDFAHAVRGRLGSLPLRDVLDGVDAMVRRDVADPEALGVGGWSYGGYLTAWAISQTDRFAAAVIGAGISDFYSFIGSSPLAPAWQRFVPDTRYPERAGFDAISPLSHLSGCRTPSLVLHGSSDGKIPVDQARMLHRGLVALGVRTELRVFPDEGHTIEAVPARTELLRATLDWFREHLGSARPTLG